MSTKITRETFLEAVRRYRTLTFNILADKLGVNRSSIGRFATSNPNVIKEAEELLNNVVKINFSENNVATVEMFKDIPIIRDWIDMLEKKGISPKQKQAYIRNVYNCCNALGVHPSKLDIDYTANKVFEWKIAKEKGEKYPQGCAYNTVAKGLRSFLMLVYEVSGESLTMKGIGAEQSKGFGTMSSERIPKEVRKRMIENMPKAVKRVCEMNNRINYPEGLFDYLTNEMCGISYFMYYTATRIEATLATRFDDDKNVYTEDYWEIHITDKGKHKKGRIEWQKRLISHGLDSMKQYIEDRFNIPKDEQEFILPTFDSAIFPLLSESVEAERAFMRTTMLMSGFKTRMQNHIFRHTFAQDWLDAMDGNYEVGAEIGGWKDIGTMKKCYGKVSSTAIMRGLKKAHGIKVEEAKGELRF